MKRIFYFNITYGCNSNCVFCYSHNTRHNSESYNEMLAEQFFQYLECQGITSRDRVIINGGEPLLHTEIEKILIGLIQYKCEVLIYTNGRLINNYDFTVLNKNFRFIVPIHGYETIHDSITGAHGSYKETIKGLKYLVEGTECLVDIKLILNNRIISEDPIGRKVLQEFEDTIVFNNAIHLTKMADTIISVRNHCQTIINEKASTFMQIFFDYFKDKNVKIKIFDTCIKSMSWLENKEVEKYKDSIEVYFKDKNQYRVMELSKNLSGCRKNCPFIDKCISAVDEYKTLEYFEDKIYENLE